MHGCILKKTVGHKIQWTSIEVVKLAQFVSFLYYFKVKSAIFFSVIVPVKRKTILKNKISRLVSLEVSVNLVMSLS